MGLTYRSNLDRPLNITEIDDNFRHFTGSHAVTGSVTATEGFIGSLTGSVSGSATTAESASYALTASYALNGGGGAAFPHVGDAEVSGTLYMSGSIIPATGGVSVTSSFDLGSATNAWKDIYVSNGSIKFISSGSSVSLGVTEDGAISTGKFSLTEDLVQGNNSRANSAVVSLNQAFLGEGYGIRDLELANGDTTILTISILEQITVTTLSASFAAIGNEVYFYSSRTKDIINLTGSVAQVTESNRRDSFEVTLTGDLKEELEIATHVVSKIEGSLPGSQQLNLISKPAVSTGFQTHAMGQSAYAQGDTTFAVSQYARITSIYTGSGDIYVDDKSAFSVGDEVCYVYDATANVNQIVRGVVTAVSESSEVVTVSGSLLGIDSQSHYHGLSPDTSSIGVLLNLTATGTNSNARAEGSYTIATGLNAHAEGRKTAAIGDHSHAEGVQTLASAIAAHAEGYGTIASTDYQSVCGVYNEESDSRFVVGNGDGFTSRKNAFEVTQNGSIKLPQTITTTTPDWTGTEGEMVFYNTGGGGSYGFCIFLGGAWRSGSLS